MNGSVEFQIKIENNQYGFWIVYMYVTASFHLQHFGILDVNYALPLEKIETRCNVLTTILE